MRIPTSSKGGSEEPRQDDWADRHTHINGPIALVHGDRDGRHCNVIDGMCRAVKSSGYCTAKSAFANVPIALGVPKCPLRINLHRQLKIVDTSVLEETEENKKCSKLLGLILKNLESIIGHRV